MPIKHLDKVIYSLAILLFLLVIISQLPEDSQKWQTFWQLIGSIAAAAAAVAALITTNNARRFERERAQKEDYANSVALYALVSSINSTLARLCSQPTNDNLNSADARLDDFITGCRTHPLPLELVFLVPKAEELKWFIYDIKMNQLPLNAPATIKYISTVEMDFRNAKFALRKRVYCKPPLN